MSKIMDIKNYYNLYVENSTHVSLITEIKRILDHNKNVCYLESNVNKWTIQEMYNFYQVMFLNFVTTPIVYNYNPVHSSNYILNGTNIVTAVIMLINDQIELPLSLFGEDSSEKMVFSKLPFNIQRRLYNCNAVFYNIKSINHSAICIISDIIKYS